MQCTAGARPLERLEALDGRDPRHVEVPTGHHDAVETLGPPFFFLFLAPLHRPPQGYDPLGALLGDPLDAGAVLHQRAVPLAGKQARDVAAQDRPVPEGRVGAVHGDAPGAALVGDRLGAAPREAHDRVVDVALEVGVNGALGEARLLWGGNRLAGGQVGRNGEGRVGGAVGEGGQVGEIWRRGGVADPVHALSVSGAARGWVT